MKKIILIGFCVCGLVIQVAISQSVATLSKNLSYVGDQSSN